jgi:hypothetical protein
LVSATKAEAEVQTPKLDLGYLLDTVFVDLVHSSDAGIARTKPPSWPALDLHDLVATYRRGIVGER